MTTRVARCRCGALQARCTGEPLRVSVCHCQACQARTGSAFGVQARWPADQVSVEGEAREWVRTADSGRRAVYRFCPTCGSTVVYQNENWPGLLAVPVGAFGDPTFPSPRHSVYEHRRHNWLVIQGDDVERSESPSSTRT